jgi:hypothetical protein
MRDGATDKTASISPVQHQAALGTKMRRETSILQFRQMGQYSRRDQYPAAVDDRGKLA